ncbi:AAA family ATPase [Blastococcus sp. CCUG 61487]|uniref:AAA family ATPase n=1 Tax=Blastococcus sp. CCUG 61487 TaxID=1840703 RepID=UPI0010C0E4D3|nr:AAA family ATPase [Blastococcus sp. CCUG 61487]TKJ35897.1 hypothetical protein A6V29_01295 [Blastococcus sp. CCUG 61487]
MRLTKVHIRGYKRLADASCNLDGRLIALLGPNEAGKSSVLEALAWLSEEDSEELPGPSRSRSISQHSAAMPVVYTRFALEDDDHSALSDLDTDDKPYAFIFQKMLDGSWQTNVEPTLNRSRGPLDKALAALDRFDTRFQSLIREQDDVQGWIDAVRACLQEAEDDHRGSCGEELKSLREWCHERTADDATSAKTGDAIARFATVLDDLSARLDADPPHLLARKRLRARVPEFLLFEERDRVLQTEYNLADVNLHNHTPPALVNLLSLGETSVPILRRVQKTGDTTRIKTHLKEVNQRLAERLKPTWRQAKLTVALAINGDLLEVLIDEEGGDTTAIHERSDGLKTFIALVCFLARHHSDIPPVLMLDEAETHLHYDAQADLIDVLLHNVRTSKVIYTTHSPGCLPPDLGTGIRLVAPIPGRAASVLRNDFWASNEPGFSPLLFAMGAGAAAFSVCRRAVLAEGPSDMILLPTLIRIATNATDVGYQVAPGLSSAPISDLTNEAVAARVVYLVDGDQPGSEYQANLVAAGVDRKRIFALPSGSAVEDLITPECFVSVVAALMTDTGYVGPAVTTEALDGPGPIASRLAEWCKSNGAPLIGKPAVASRLVQRPSEITLTADGKKALKVLHKAITKALA